MNSPHQILPTLLAVAALLTPSASALNLLGYWDFNDAADPAVAPNTFGPSPAADLVVATFSADGVSGAPGDLSLDLGGASNGAYALVPAGSHLDRASNNDAMAVSYWQYNTQIVNSSTFWFTAPAAINNQRGFQAHVPWGNGSIFFDTAGCCDTPSQRLTDNVVAETKVLLNTWQHFVFQKDAAGNKQVWIDGTLSLDQVGGANSFLPFDGGITIGANANVFVDAFSGRVDEFAVFDDALTPEQIALLAGGAPASDLIDTTDADGDGLFDAFEQRIIDADPDDLITTIEDVLPGDDFDMDGLTNVEERDADTDPVDNDSDDDGLLDGVETNDGMFADASHTGTDPNNADSDGDGISDGDEVTGANGFFTNPNLADTDDDGFDDQLEIDNGTDPVNPDDFPSGFDLLACWDFDDIADPLNTVDVINGHVGELQGGAAYTADAGGRSGSPGDYGMDFGIDNAGQTVLIADASFLNAVAPLDRMSFLFWQKLSAVSNSSAFWATSPASTGNQRGAQGHTPWGNGTMYFDTAGCCIEPTQRLQGAPLAAVDWTQWHHLAFVKNGDTKEVWVDGVLQISNTGASPLPTDFTQLWLGSELSNNSLQGVLDDFAVFGKALTGEEIAAFMDIGHAPSAPFAITSVVRGVDDRVTITFNARNNVPYAVDVSSDGMLWEELDDGVMGVDGVATYTDNSSDPAQPTLLYRAREL